MSSNGDASRALSRLFLYLIILTVNFCVCLYLKSKQVVSKPASLLDVEVKTLLWALPNGTNP